MIHTPVLQQEVIKVIAPQKNENFIDCTLGFGGHSSKILKKNAPNGKLLGIEQDEIALQKAKENLDEFGDRFQFYLGNFKDLGLVVREWNVNEINGILIDLGPSTYQLKDKERGFSFLEDSHLDMRMNLNQKLNASDIVNKYSQKEIEKILFSGEEKFARAISHRIVTERKIRPIETTYELLEVIKKAIPPSVRHSDSKHFATGTFRALRIAVNRELENLKAVLPQAVSILSPRGRIAVISFHSLEDRIVKQFFKEREDLKIITDKPIIATDEEIEKNPSSRSAKLRAAIKI